MSDRDIGPEIAFLTGFLDGPWMCWRPSKGTFEDLAREAHRSTRHRDVLWREGVPMSDHASQLMVRTPLANNPTARSSTNMPSGSARLPRSPPRTSSAGPPHPPLQRCLSTC